MHKTQINPRPMKAEIVSTDYFDQEAIRLPDYKVGRVSYGHGRSYIRLVDGAVETPFRLYTSLTTAINTCAPMNQGLLEWNVKHGLKEAGRLLKIAQRFGTALHILIGEFLMVGSVNLDELDEWVQNYLSTQEFWEPECADWAENLKYDMIAFAQFCADYNIKVMGIEYVLLSDRFGFGTPIDLVCKMDIPTAGFYGEVYKSGERKGEPKETKQPITKTVIINFKSGRHGFYPNNGIQAIAEKMLWEENFPDIPLEGAYNWSPKEWRDTPSYNLKDWMGEVGEDEVEHIMGLAKIRFGDKAMEKEYLSVGGVVYRGKAPELNVSKIGVEEFCRKKFGELMA